MERKLIAAAVSGALALPMAAQAVEFSASGQVSRAIISVDGQKNDNDLQHVDANVSQSRFRFTGSEELENGMVAAVGLEYGLTANLRQAHGSLSGPFGKLTIGHTNVTADGPQYASFIGPANMGGATNWCPYSSTGPACQSYGPSRQPILRYDTPAIGPASIGVSTGNNDYFDAALKIAGSFGDAGYDLRIGFVSEYDVDVAAVPHSVTPVAAGVLRKTLTTAKETVEEHFKGGLSLQDDEGALVTDDELTAMAADKATADTLVYKNQTAKAATTKAAGDAIITSAAFAFGQGTSIAVGWGQEDVNDGENQFAALGHSYGAGSVAIYYARGEEMVAGAMTEGSHWGVAVGHDVGGGVDAYAGYRVMQEDHKEDVSLLLAGMRVKFN
jgi:predicted porin